jgi:hypothetical protein
VRGQARAVVGTVRASNGADPALSGTTITNAEGTAFGLSFIVGNASVGSAGASSGPGVGHVINVSFVTANRRLDVGDSAIGWVDDSSRTFTVIDCRTVPAVP